MKNLVRCKTASGYRRRFLPSSRNLTRYDDSLSLACPCIHCCARQWRPGDRAIGGLATPVQRLYLPAGCGGPLRHVIRSIPVSVFSSAAWNGSHLSRRKYAWGHDDLLPVSESYYDGLNGWGASISDALGTMVRVPFELRRFARLTRVRACSGSWVSKTGSKTQSTTSRRWTLAFRKRTTRSGKVPLYVR